MTIRLPRRFAPRNDEVFVMDILNQFGVQPILLAAQVVNFLILLFILKKFLYSPILKVLENRRKTAEQTLKNAEEIEKKLLLTEEEKEKILAKATSDIQKMMDEAKKEREVMREEGKIQAEKLVAQIIKKGEESARAEAERVKGEMISNMVEIVGMVTEKVTRGALDKNKEKQIIEKEVRNL